MLSMFSPDLARVSPTNLNLNFVFPDKFQLDQIQNGHYYHVNRSCRTIPHYKCATCAARALINLSDMSQASAMSCERSLVLSSSWRHYDVSELVMSPHLSLFSVTLF